MNDMTNNDMEKITVNTEVLIVGGSAAGLKAAAGIAACGYKVCLIESNSGIDIQKKELLTGLGEQDIAGLKELEKEVLSNSRIEILTDTNLVGVNGVPGDFNLKLENKDGIIGKKTGAIVIATGFTIKPLNDKYQLSLSDNVITQSSLEEMLAAGDQSAREKLAGKTVAFLLGFGNYGYPIVMERLVRSILAIEQIEGCTAYVYAGDLKVASDSLERIYKESRDNGATYFRLSQMPEISQDGKKVTFFDPVLRQDMELSPDLLVIEEEICADQSNDELAGLLRIDMEAAGLMQKDNVHRFPVSSNREGIFVIGASREVQNLPLEITDAVNAVLGIKNLLGDGTRMVPKERGIVDTGKCVFCITCYRCCPHGAIYWDEDNKAVISPLACQACGICASECPMDAIQIGGFIDADLKEEIQQSIEPDAKAPQIVAFCCRNSAFEAGMMAKTFNMPVPEGLKMIKMPCAGKIDLDYILTAFVEGADGVLVLTCHNGNCKSERGNIFAEWRVDDAHRMLEESGFGKERLQFATLASNTGSRFSAIVCDMEKTINNLA
ncbi:MAG: hydrogenase iron-sulfur subunit [Deltaproteobacteria bacterium]|nr:hydrogenase iron-sulfur subunit [Deltaproteobacteria bacterium]